MACGLLSGNRHLEGRLCNCVRANYLASPPLVVAYAIAGTVSINLETEPLGVNSEGKEVFLRDIWPSKEEVRDTEENVVIASMFKELRSRIEVRGNCCYSFIKCDFVRFSLDDNTDSFVCAERKCVLEQFRLSRISPFPLGSQVHLHQLSVLLQQTCECLFDPDLYEDQSLCSNIPLLPLRLKRSTLLCPSTMLTLCSFWVITSRPITFLQPVALLESVPPLNTSSVNGEFLFL